MKKGLGRVFLFAKSAEDHRAIFWVWNVFFVLASGVVIGLESLLLAYGNYHKDIFTGYFAHPTLILLNVLPAVMLTAALWLACGRAWIAHLVSSLVVVGFSVGDYFKLVFRDDPLLAVDMKDIGIGVKFGVGSYSLFINARIAVCIVCTVVGTLFLAFFVRARIKFRRRAITWAVRAGGVLLLALCVLPLRGVYTDNALYNSIENFDYPKANVWSSTQRFITRGFVYPFLHSVPDAIQTKPDGYSKDAAEQILSAYVDDDIPSDRKVNIIGIQFEAFNDLERLGVTGINDAVYANYRLLEAESYTGRLITNIFAGGTVDTERTFLTGLYRVDDFRHDLGSYVRYFGDQGYFTEGAHPCYDWFYNRKNVNKYIGFDEYWFIENRYGEMNNGNVVYDDQFIPDLVKLYFDRDKSVPYFNFSVTYQGHGPYATYSYTMWGDGWWNAEGARHDTYYILNNYFALVKNTNDNVWDMVNRLRDDPDPVVLVMFGDHNPWLGNSNSVYADLVINLDTSTEEGFYNYYSTRYVIWANDAAKKTLGFDFSGSGPDMSPCFLMNQLFDICGFGSGSKYMQFMDDMYSYTPVLNTGGFYVENGKVTAAPSAALAEQLHKLEIVQYYRKQTPTG